MDILVLFHLLLLHYLYDGIRRGRAMEKGIVKEDGGVSAQYILIFPKSVLVVTLHYCVTRG